MLYRDSWIEVNLSAFQDNIRYLKKYTNKKLIAIIKANGYGTGNRLIALSALKAGADLLAVSSLDEALFLRSEGIESDILVLGFINPKFAHIMRDYNITATALSIDWVKEFIHHGGQGCKVQIKVETGMNRIGIYNLEDLQEAHHLLIQHGVLIDGIFTHFACSDQADNIYTDKQMKRFEVALNLLGRDYQWIHTSNSDAAIHYHENISNATRCGIAMFGVSSYKTELKPMLSLKSKVICIKKVPAHEYIGYGSTYMTKKDEWIATIPIGYADGWCRKNQGRLAYIDDLPCEFVGRICMDQSMLRVSENTKVGDVVELIGEHMPITQVATELDTITHEIMTSLTDRLTKIYYENGKKIKTVNPRFAHHNHEGNFL